MTALFGRVHMPSFGAGTAWLNSGPLDPSDLRGRVVLVDFWTLTCINWLRTEPWIRAWSRAYRADGLVVIGVHTPEFGFEHDLDLVRLAIGQRDIDYPVVVDNDYGVWSAFDNHYWPAEYFVDREGIIRDQHFGEGRYEQSERELQRLLGIDRAPVSVTGEGVEAEADWDGLRTPETYLGFERGERFASPGRPVAGETRTYEQPGSLMLDHWALSGRWRIEPEDALLDQAGGGVAFRFSARDAHLVLSSVGGDPIPFRVLLDGAAPGPSHGEDVDATGDGVLREGRLYQLVRQADGAAERTVQITFAAPGARAHVFTFG